MTTIQIRRGTTAQWAATNPILAAGEEGLNTTTGVSAIGDGVHHWLDLDPFVRLSQLGSYVAQIPTVGSYTYDGSGRVTSDPDGNTYTYNSDDTIATITKGGVTRTATYSANGIASWA